MVLPEDMQPGPDGVIRVVCSFSGGRSSSVSTERVLAYYSAVYDYEKGLHIGACPLSFSEVHIVVLFTNTSREDDRTLQFVQDCDLFLGFGSRWLEAVVSPTYRKGTGVREVFFHTAHRDGSVFEDVISKYGLPNNNLPHCTRELKLRPIEKFLAAQFGWGNVKGRLPHYTVVGFRSDEPKRWASAVKRRSQLKKKVILPLVDWWRMDKRDVTNWCNRRFFDLNIAWEHEGNCRFCFKKNELKLVASAITDPEGVEWVSNMEKKFGHFVPDTRTFEGELPIRFFRNRLSVWDLVEMAKNYLEGADTEIYRNTYLDVLSDKYKQSSGDCGDSCEAFVL